MTEEKGEGKIILLSIFLPMRSSLISHETKRSDIDGMRSSPVSEMLSQNICVLLLTV
jgi:hypothetical protein